jgi:hypothetical protein
MAPALAKKARSSLDNTLQSAGSVPAGASADNACAEDLAGAGAGVTSRLGVGMIVAPGCCVCVRLLSRKGSGVAGREMVELLIP